MEIYEHELRMNLAVAIIWFIERFVLPEYFQRAQSFGDVLNQIVPCDFVGDLAAERVSVPFVPVDALVEAACREGVEAQVSGLLGSLLILSTLMPSRFGANATSEIRELRRPSKPIRLRMVFGRVACPGPSPGSCFKGPDWGLIG